MRAQAYCTCKDVTDWQSQVLPGRIRETLPMEFNLGSSR